MTLLFSFLAGVLSILSPCVLPLLPLVLGAAISKSKWGVYALSAGLALSFVVIGLFFATIGFSLNVNQDYFRFIAALILMVMGIFLVFPTYFAPISQVITGFTNKFETKFAGKNAGQFFTGALLGVIWTPCVGPTLGAASLLAAKGENLLEVALIMLIFGLGAALPLLIIGLFAIKNLRFLSSGINTAKTVFGILLILTALSIITGYDKIIEATLINISPEWLNKLSTYF